MSTRRLHNVNAVEAYRGTEVLREAKTLGDVEVYLDKIGWTG